MTELRLFQEEAHGMEDAAAAALATESLAIIEERRRPSCLEEAQGL